MTFKEYLDKNENAVENMDFEGIDELKKFADKEKIVYSEGELKQAWGYIKCQSASEDGEELDDDALDAVAGGKGDTYIYQNNNCGNQTGCNTTINDNSNNTSIGKVNGNTNIKS